MENCDGVLEFCRSMGGGVIVVPVETMVGRVGDGCSTFPAPEDMAWSSGVLMIISEARLISDCFSGMGALRGGENTCFSGDVDGTGVARDGFVATAPGWLIWNALSECFSGALLPTTGELVLSKSN